MIWPKLFKLIFVFVCLSLATGQFSMLYKDTGVSFYLFDLFVAFFAFLGVSFTLIRKIQVHISFAYFSLFSFIVWGLLSLGFNSYIGTYNVSETTIALFYPLRLLVYLLAALNIKTLVQEGIFSEDFVYKTFLTSGVLVFMAGLVQLLILPDFTVLDSSLGWDPHKNRMASTFFDPNFLGMYFVFLLGMVFGIRVKSGIMKICLGSIFVLGIVLTFSRSAWGALAILVVVVGLRYRKLFLASMLLVFLAYFSVPRIQTRLSGVTDPADSAAFRLISWKNATEVFNEHMFYGAGFNFYRYVQKDYGFFDVDSLGGNSGAGADSSLLFVLAVSGVPGFLMFISFFGYYAFGFVKNEDVLSLGMLLALMFNSFFINSLFYPQILLVYLVYFKSRNRALDK